jgi:hypothetical protein
MGVGKKTGRVYDYRVVIAAENVDESIIYAALSRIMSERPDFLTKINARRGNVNQRKGTVEFAMGERTLVLTRIFMSLYAKSKGVVVKLFWKKPEDTEETK